MDKIVKKVVQNSRIIESRELARTVRSALASHLSRHYAGVKDLGAKGGPFWVLLGSEMPAILIEAGHLSNPEEIKRLQSAVYRQNIARGIFQGIKAYIRSLGGDKPMKRRTFLRAPSGAARLSAPSPA